MCKTYNPLRLVEQKSYAATATLYKRCIGLLHDWLSFTAIQGIAGRVYENSLSAGWRAYFINRDSYLSFDECSGKPRKRILGESETVPMPGQSPAKDTRNCHGFIEGYIAGPAAPAEHCTQRSRPQSQDIRGIENRSEVPLAFSTQSLRVDSSATPPSILQDPSLWVDILTKLFFLPREYRKNGAIDFP